MTTSFLPLFHSLPQTGWELDGDNLLVEVFDEGEDAKEITRADGTKASLVLAAPTNERQLDSYQDRKPILVRVLKVGRGYYKEDGSPEPVDVLPGAILEVPKMAISWRSRVLSLIIPEKKLGYVTRSSALQTFPSEEAYQATCDALKRTAAARE